LTDWKAIIIANGPAVWRTLYRIVGSSADADDCFQDVFMEAVKTSRRRRIEHWPAWLQRLAVSRAIDHLRRRRGLRSRAEPADLESLASIAADSGQLAQSAERARQLRAALAELSADQAEAITLHLFNEWSYEEIAGELETSVSNVGVLIHRAKARLRELLESEHERIARQD
jgi:RNA polymerase sigma-70 factor (ECF subfamily)